MAINGKASFAMQQLLQVKLNRDLVDRRHLGRSGEIGLLDADGFKLDMRNPGFGAGDRAVDVNGLAGDRGQARLQRPAQPTPLEKNHRQNDCQNQNTQQAEQPARLPRVHPQISNAISNVHCCLKPGPGVFVPLTPERCIYFWQGGFAAGQGMIGTALMLFLGDPSISLSL